MPAAGNLPVRVLFATPEAHPVIKTGGLGDVSGALPAALKKEGADVRVLLPAYGAVLAALPGARPVADLGGIAPFPDVRLLEAQLPGGVPLLLIDCPSLYGRPGGPYQDGHGHDWPDNPRRFGLLSKVAAVLADGHSPLPWQPQILHCNDWQTGLAPAYLHFGPGPRAKTVMAIHNLLFQGVYALGTAGLLGLPPESLGIEGVEYYGNLSFLKAGIHYADRIATVSPSYALEIQTEALGFGMHGLLRHRRRHLRGIVNGIDTEAWDPLTDPHIAQNYGPDALEKKAVNKRLLQRAMGLKEDAEIPLLGVICRLTLQKGIDLLLAAAPQLMKLPAQIAVLGSGEPQLQRLLAAFAGRHPAMVAARTQFDEPLSHLIEAGADIFLMPSRFEPCGLNQMYSQRYGTPPVVHATGGLKDTVTDCTPDTQAAGTATGFAFTAMTPAAFVAAVRRAIAALHDQEAWRRIQRAGMARDFSWAASARQYLDLYRSLLA
ncbi:MAG: glycogen synthase GlgA [Betaproteobacteria bacterium]|nr:glycogen synthase GlgA [Betaproteobacteria bacterium]